MKIIAVLKVLIYCLSVNVAQASSNSVYVDPFIGTASDHGQMHPAASFKDYPYIKSVRLNGHLIDRAWLSHQEIVKGGELKIELSADANPAWGNSEKTLSKIGG